MNKLIYLGGEYIFLISLMEQRIACANPSKTINIISFPEMSTQAQWLKRIVTSTKWSQCLHPPENMSCPP